MKLIVAFLALVMLILAYCTPQKKVEYTIPDNYEGQVKENLIKYLDEGQQLYRLHCSKCHGIFGKGKDSIPNFTKTQVELYRNSILLEDSTNHSVVQGIRIEDIDKILMFLTFRKKSAPPIPPPAPVPDFNSNQGKR